jgi:hypothetical protein
MNDDGHLDLERIADLVRRQGASLEPGLSPAEIEAIEVTFGFRFPDDLRALLTAFLPQGYGFPNWRSRTDADLRDRLDWPADGIAFDIERNGFWMADWGAKPSEPSDSIAIARERIAAAPKLVPIYSHRYLPCEPSAAGSPVYSVYQTDIVFYGVDLEDYFENEFGSRGHSRIAAHRIRRIRFWSELVE